MIERHYLDDCLVQLRKLKTQADKAMAQIDDSQFFARSTPTPTASRSSMKHVSGNMRSRSTDFLTTDGEKPIGIETANSSSAATTRARPS